jgi:hypothetical protein
MPTASQIAQSMGTSIEKGRQLYNESVDWCAQKSSLLDKRDQAQIKWISVKVQTLARRTAMSLANKTDQIYISTRAPPCFKSCTMFEAERKVAKMAELLQKAKEETDRRNASLREQNMEDVPITLGNVADKVRIFTTGALLKAQAKRPPSALDGVASIPPPKRASAINQWRNRHLLKYPVSRKRHWPG